MESKVSNLNDCFDLNKIVEKLEALSKSNAELVESNTRLCGMIEGYQKPYFTEEEAAKYLGVSRAHIKRHYQDARKPKGGNAVRYVRKKLDSLFTEAL